MKSILKKRRSSDSSDSDDWTLLSGPHSDASSSSSSSDPKVTFEDLSRHCSRHSPSPASTTAEDDGLTEIDLNASTSNPLLLSVNCSSSTGETSKDPREDPSPMPGFTALDTTDDDDEDNDDHDDDDDDELSTDEETQQMQQGDRSPSLGSSSELVEYVNIDGKICIGLEADVNSKSAIELNAQGEISQSDSEQRQSETLSAHRTNSTSMVRQNSSSTPNVPSSSTWKYFKRLCVAAATPTEQADADSQTKLSRRICVVILVLVALKYLEHKEKLSVDSVQSSSSASSLNNKHQELTTSRYITSNHQLNELRLLHDELSQCIKRQSPTSFKYYMSENQFKQQHSEQRNSGSKSSNKPYRSLVCYGQESQWRQRFDRLKSKFNLDLRSLVQETKHNITNAMLKSKHPALQFTLILDQLEYLQFLENKRNKKQNEETIKHLKAENLQLLRRLNQPSENNYQKLVVSLELRNSRLQRENEALKANLVEKAGTVYMKQSVELEQYERENIMLKQFYQQVAQDISKSLKQFNLHAVDATQSLDDHEILHSQLMLTRGYLRKLGEKISSVLLENESLKEELRQSYLNNVLGAKAGGTNLQTSPSQKSDHYSAVGAPGNESNALVADSCMRNLLISRQRTKELELEVSRLKSVASSRCNSVDLEHNDRNVRHLNRTGQLFSGLQMDSSKRFRAPKQLPDSSSTAMGKRYRDSLALANEEIVEGLMTFLTKFNHEVESKNFALIETSDKEVEPELLTTTSKGLLAGDDQSDMKIIPVYIREEMRSRLVAEKKTRGQSVDLLSNTDDSVLPINFGADLFNQTAEDVVASDSQDQEQQRRQTESNPHEVAPPAEAAPDAVESPSAPSEVMGEKNSSEAITEEEYKESDSNNKGSWVKRMVSDGWFFRRAKQRKHLRGRHNDRKDLHGRHSNWAIKRAKLREKLREKLRKAWQYIEDTFTSTTSGKYHNKQHAECPRHPHQHRRTHHQPDVAEKSRHTCKDPRQHQQHNHNNKKTTATTTHWTDHSHYRQRSFKSDNLHDEL